MKSEYFRNFPLGFKDCTFDPKDKGSVSLAHLAYMLDRTNEIFRYEGLPETIPPQILELFLQCNGNVCFFRVDGDLRVFIGGFGGKPDIYYRPTQYIIANPALRKSYTATIDEDCVVMRNDTMFQGLLPLLTRYAAALTENELSMWIASINSRIQSIITADTDAAKASAEQYLSRVWEGKLGVITDKKFTDGLKAQPYGTSGSATILKSLIEMEQYLKGSFFNEIGLNAMFNMKREAINESESDMNVDGLLPLVDNMLKCRQEDLKRVNAMFGTNITVQKNSAWKDVEEYANPEESAEDPEATSQADSETPGEAVDPGEANEEDQNVSVS